MQRSGASYVGVVWKYDLRDWHTDTGLSHEEWLLQLQAEGWEPEWYSRGGSHIEVNGRMVVRLAVKRWAGLAEGQAQAAAVVEGGRAGALRAVVTARAALCPATGTVPWPDSSASGALG